MPPLKFPFHGAARLAINHVQGERRLHIFASLGDVIGAIVPKALYVLETMLHFVSKGVDEELDQRIGRASLDCLLR